ncbi:unnamed protein product [Auanema sp. JU1783]|nr:unnamed protein product [Auanema sp. JU1783]
MISFTSVYLIVSTKSSQSVQFLANQRRLTIGIIYFVFLELVGLGLPIICLAVCGMFNVGLPIFAQYAFISMSIYPIFGPYYVLMSNVDYRNRVDMIIKRTRLVTSPAPPSTTIL